MDMKSRTRMGFLRRSMHQLSSCQGTERPCIYPQSSATHAICPSTWCDTCVSCSEHCAKKELSRGEDTCSTAEANAVSGLQPA